MSEFTPENDQLENDPEESSSGAVLLQPESYVAGDIRFAKRYVQQLRKVSIIPGIAVITLGDDKTAKNHVQKIEEACENIGVHFKHIGLAADVNDKLVRTQIIKLNNDPTVHAILLDGPLPYDDATVFKLRNEIDVRKDIEGITDNNVGKVWNSGFTGSYPALAHAIIFMAARPPVDIDGGNVVIVINNDAMPYTSHHVVTPIMRDMMDAGYAVTVCSIENFKLEDYTKSADLLISLVGNPGYITGDIIKPGAIVIDAGDYHDEDGVLIGDVDIESVMPVAGYMLDMPLCDSGFVVSTLMHHLCNLARNYGLKPYSQQLTPLDLEQIDDGLKEEEEQEEDQQPGSTELC